MEHDSHFVTFIGRVNADCAQYAGSADWAVWVIWEKCVELGIVCNSCSSWGRLKWRARRKDFYVDKESIAEQHRD
jgi:hypothetical protein